MQLSDPIDIPVEPGRAELMNDLIRTEPDIFGSGSVRKSDLARPIANSICQPLDIRIFSLLKLQISKELDNIMHYSISNIKKFE